MTFALATAHLATASAHTAQYPVDHRGVLWSSANHIAADVSRKCRTEVATLSAATCEPVREEFVFLRPRLVSALPQLVCQHLSAAAVASHPQPPPSLPSEFAVQADGRVECTAGRWPEVPGAAKVERRAASACLQSTRCLEVACGLRGGRWPNLVRAAFISVPWRSTTLCVSQLGDRASHPLSAAIGHPAQDSHPLGPAASQSHTLNSRRLGSLGTLAD